MAKRIRKLLFLMIALLLIFRHPPQGVCVKRLFRAKKQAVGTVLREAARKTCWNSSNFGAKPA